MSCEISFSHHVCELVFGDNVTDLNFWIQINPVKQQVQSNSVGSRNMSHCGTSTFDHHFEYRLIFLKDIQHRAPESEIFVLDGLLSKFVGMTLVCFIGMGLCMFGLTTVDGLQRSSLSLLGPSVLFDAE